jgi:hypothetical protein
MSADLTEADQDRVVGAQARAQAGSQAGAGAAA